MIQRRFWLAVLWALLSFGPGWAERLKRPNNLVLVTDDQRWKYIRYLETDPLYEELYDLQNDPHEEHNLAFSPEHQELLAQMRRKRTTWHEQVR